MAYNNKLKNKFIEMYAINTSLSECSRELSISVPTLTKWREESADKIFELKNKLKQEKELENEKMITERINLINSELERAYLALEKISINKMKSKNLIYFIERLENKINDPLLDEKLRTKRRNLVFFDEFGEEIEDFQKRLFEII